MSSPAASAPLAVLVLAWDETTPAARVLVEATEMQEPAADSVVALVPTGPPANELSQEEFLPLEPSLGLSEPPASTAPATELPIQTVQAAVPKIEAFEAEPATPLAAASPAAALPAPSVEVAPPLPAAAATAEALVKPALVWQEVRVLRLSTHSPAALASYSGQVEPNLVWAGTANVPAAPYLGSSELALAAQGGPAANIPPLATSLLAATETATSALVTLRTPGLLAVNSLPPASGETAPSPTYPLAELPAAPDAESDATPAPAPGEPMPLADASPTELSEEAAAPGEPFAVDTTLVQAAPVAPTPAATEPLTEPDFAAGESPQLAALRPAGQPFDAPNLNFQIIQYARLAVPQALAEQPFGVIYAPAWPTWLAAQELRYRSGQPLVLHLAQLAAADELIDLAAGWVAEIQRQALHRADLILTETPALAQRLRHELALPAHRVRPVPAANAAAVAQALRTVVRE